MPSLREAHAQSSIVLRVLGALSYTTFLVQEQCGVRSDCRNLLSFPDERVPAVLRSPTLDLAARASWLVFVNASNVRWYATYRKSATNAWKCQVQWYCINNFANWVPREVIARHGTKQMLDDTRLRVGVVTHTAFGPR